VSISTHVLDTARGCPGAGLAVSLSRRGSDGAWSVVREAVTDGDGRVRELASGPLEPGEYRLEFATAAYFKAAGTRGFYPQVCVVFSVTDSGASHHVPLLLSPFGYSTYRGT
jgi:5-hydroxyisourate hydrolase